MMQEPVMNNTDYLETFESRRQCFRELLELSRCQPGLVAEGSYVQLVALLGSKQRLLARLDDSGESHPHFLDAWRRDRERIPHEVRAQCERILAESETLLAQLIEAEHHSTELLTRKRDATRRQISEISQAGKVNLAYGESLAPVTHRHLNVDQ
jgi:hypothetical protein